MGVKVVFNNLPDVEKELHKELGSVVAVVALAIEGTAKESMTEPKTGREYKRKNGKHRASAPGQAPAIDTGALANSIQADTTKANSDLYAEVTAGTEYAEMLEFGTGKMSPRPFMTPAAENHRGDFKVGAEKGVKRAARRVSKATRAGA